MSLFSPATKKKSSLSRETDPLDTSDQFTDDVPDSGPVSRQQNFPRRSSSFTETVPTEPTRYNYQNFDSSKSNRASDDKEEQNEQATLQDISNFDKHKVETLQRETATMGKI